MFSWVSRLLYCLRTTSSSRGRGASDAAASCPCRQDPGELLRNTYVPPRGDALLARCLPVPRLAMATTAAAAASAGPLRAAGAEKQCRGGSRRDADLSAPAGDFEVTSGGCRVWQLQQQAGCAWLHQRCQTLRSCPC